MPGVACCGEACCVQPDCVQANQAESAVRKKDILFILVIGDPPGANSNSSESILPPALSQPEAPPASFSPALDAVIDAPAHRANDYEPAADETTVGAPLVGARNRAPERAATRAAPTIGPRKVSRGEAQCACAAAFFLYFSKP